MQETAESVSDNKVVVGPDLEKVRRSVQKVDWDRLCGSRVYEVGWVHVLCMTCN